MASTHQCQGYRTCGWRLLCWAVFLRGSPQARIPSYCQQCRAPRGCQTVKRPTMSLSAWEQQVLNSIRDGLAGSDPKLAALLSAFTRLTSGEEMPTAEGVPVVSRRALRRLRRARWRSSLRRVLRRLGSRRAMLLLWPLITAALISVALALSAHDHSTTCIPEGLVCASPSPGHSSDSASHNATLGPAPQRRAVGIPPVGP